MLGLTQKAVFHGPNPYANSPVIVVNLQIEEELEQQVEKLCGALRTQSPRWFQKFEPDASSPVVFLGQTAAHWALRALNEVRGFLHDAGAKSTRDGADIWLGFHDEAVSRNALQLAFKALLQGTRPEFSPEAIRREIGTLLQACAKRHPDYQAQILMQAARSTGIPVRPFIQGTKIWQYGWGTRSRLFMECAPIENGGKSITGGKILSKAVFNAIGAPVPTHHVVNERSDLVAAAKSVGYPCVVKPVQGNKGTGVTAGIRSFDELQAGFDEATRSGAAPVMVETFVAGHDHRLLVAEGRVVRAIRREPSSVVGDGSRSIAQLIDSLNQQRSMDVVKSRYLRPVQADDILLRHLTGQGVSPNSVPLAGQRITLRSNANISTGGIATDVTDALHHHTGRMAEMIAETMGLVTAGVDFITHDISKSFVEAGAFIEINSNPGLGMVIASGGDPLEIGKQILGNRPGRIPVTLVVMPEAERLEAQMWLKSQQWAADAAWACADIAGIGQIPLCVTSGAAWPGPDVVLKHRSAGQVWIFCSDQELMQRGLPVDRVDRARLSTELPDEWKAVVSACAKDVEALPDWRDALAYGDAVRSETAPPR